MAPSQISTYMIFRDPHVPTSIIEYEYVNIGANRHGFVVLANYCMMCTNWTHLLTERKLKLFEGLQV